MLNINNYAKALFDLSKEQKQIHEVFSDLNLFEKTLEENRAWAYYASIEDFKKTDKKIDQFSFKSKIFSDFLKVVVKDKLIYRLKDIRDKYFRLADEYLNIAYFSVKTAKEISKKELDELKKNLKKLYPKKEIIINHKTDSTLVSGIKIKNLGTEIDRTIENRLKELFFHI